MTPDQKVADLEQLIAEAEQSLSILMGYRTPAGGHSSGYPGTLRLDDVQMWRCEAEIRDLRARLRSVRRVMPA